MKNLLMIALFALFAVPITASAAPSSTFQPLTVMAGPPGGTPVTAFVTMPNVLRTMVITADTDGGATTTASTPSFFSSIVSSLLGNLSLDAIVGFVMLGVGWLLTKYLSAERRSQIAEAVSVAYHAAVGVDSMLAPGGTKNVVDKVAEVLKDVNDYSVSHGWNPLSDNEKTVAAAQIKALAGKGIVAAALGSALTSVPPKASGV